MGMFEKKELDMLRFDFTIRVFFCKTNQKIFPPCTCKRKAPQISEFSRFFLHGQYLPLYSICGSTLIPPRVIARIQTPGANRVNSSKTGTEMKPGSFVKHEPKSKLRTKLIPLG